MIRDPEQNAGLSNSADRSTPHPTRPCLSTRLPGLNTQTTYHSLREALDELQSLLNNYSIDHSSESSKHLDSLDSWQKNFAINWLTRLLSLTVRRSCTDPQDGEDECGGKWESLASDVGQMMAEITGSPATASQAFNRTYSFELQLPQPKTKTHTPQQITVEIREGTLSYPAIGSQTWNSAPLMCKRMCSDPCLFFPMLNPYIDHRQDILKTFPDTPPLTRPSTPLVITPRRSIKILELGSGTGLVGLTAARILLQLLQHDCSQVIFDVKLVLSDYHPEVLSNLEHNLKENAGNYLLPDGCPSTLSVEVTKLDWRDLKDSELARSGLAGGFDVILGSDLVYEPEHAIWASRAVRYFLRPRAPISSTKDSLDICLLPQSLSVPRKSSIREEFVPTFHLLLPLRPTFIKESQAVHQAFGGRDLDKLFDQTHQLPDTLPVHNSDWEAGKKTVVVREEQGLHLPPLEIYDYNKEEGVQFGQGCGEYQYLRIGWRLR